MKKDLTAPRFRQLLTSIVLLLVILTAFASWRECADSPSSSESSEANTLLYIAVKSLVALPEGAQADHTASTFVQKLNQSRAERMLESLSEIDVKIEKLHHEKRLKGYYSIDMDRMLAEIGLARREEKTVYGTDYDIAMAAVRQLHIGTTLSQLTWREDLPETKRGSEYWARNVARAHDGFLSHRNPWGPLYGSLLVRDADGGKSAMLRISGDGEPHENVRKKYPCFFFPAGTEIGDSMRAMLDYGDSRQIVDRKNHKPYGGKDVPAGYDVLLTLDPALQEMAASLADNALSAEHIKNATLVAMDLKSGGILVAASASEDSSKNGLVFRAIPPASTSKILFAAAMLEYPDSLKNSQATLSRLPYYLMISDPQRTFFTTAAFSGAAKPIKEQAARFGWNQDCSQNDNCVGRPMDHLYGSLQKGAVNAPIHGRIMVAESGKKNRFRLLEDAELKQLPEYSAVVSLLENNAKRPAHISKEGYDAAKVVRMTMFGQGDTRTSAFGLLHTISHVAGAANGWKEVKRPHIVSAVLNADGKDVPIPAPVAVPVGMQHENARLLAGYLAAVNSPDGTAGVPFSKVFGRNLSEKERLLFAKTGTTDSTVKGSVPLYLYVAAYSRNGREYDTAVVAVCERKGSEAQNYNHAADLALRFVKATMPETVTRKQFVASPAELKSVRSGHGK